MIDIAKRSTAASFIGVGRAMVQLCAGCPAGVVQLYSQAIKGGMYSYWSNGLTKLPSKGGVEISGIFWLVSEESFWLCAYLDKRAEVVQCASSALVGRAYSALENSMLAFYEEAIWNS